jgi:carbon monoxide dehydrogenase subunit G
MELTNEFRVGVPVARAYDVLTDVERIAPCLPGAQLQEVEGEQYRGVVKVKVGPITANYQGAATFVERDAPNKIVLRAEGREARGQGNAAAVITLTLTADGDGTAVSVVTDLTITGKVAQFGRGVLADVSAKLLGQFVECLEAKVLDDSAAPVAPAVEVAAPVADEPAAPVDAPVVADIEPVDGEAAEPIAAVVADAKPAVRRIESAPVEPVNLVSAAGNPVAKRAAPVLGAVAVLWLLRVLLRRRKRR